MYCLRFSVTLTTECCLSRQDKAKKLSGLSDGHNSYNESLIFCAKCPQGNKIQKYSLKIRDLDVVKLKRETIKMMLQRGDWSMFKIKRTKLKREE